MPVVVSLAAIVLCYDTTDRESFDHLRKWLKEISWCARWCAPSSVPRSLVLHNADPCRLA